MSGDQYFANVISLLHLDGTAGATSTTDVIGTAWTFGGGAQLSASHPAFGATGLGTTSADGTLTTSSDISFSGDFTIEAWVYITAYPGTVHDFVKIGSEAAGRYSFFFDTTGKLTHNKFGLGNVTYGTATIPLNTLTHIAWSRVGTTIYAFINGTLAGTATSISGTVGNSGGGYYNIGSTGVFVDEARLTRGVGRYTATFTAPTAAFPDQGFVASGFSSTATGTPKLIPSAKSFKTTVFGTAKVKETAHASGFKTTAFGAPVGKSVQTASGFKTTALGTPKVKPIAVGFSTTRIGIPATPLRAAGFDSTAFGIPLVATVARGFSTTAFGTAHIAFAQTEQAFGYSNTTFGIPQSFDYTPSTHNVIVHPAGRRTTAFGRPVSTLSTYVYPSGFKATTIGQPKSKRIQRASGSAAATAVGLPAATRVQAVPGFKHTVFGAPKVRLTCAAGAYTIHTRFGVPLRGGMRHAWPIPARTWFGTPRAFNGRVLTASGAMTTATGSPTARDIHRVSYSTRAAHFGTPILNRGSTC